MDITVQNKHLIVDITRLYGNYRKRLINNYRDFKVIHCAVKYLNDNYAMNSNLSIKVENFFDGGMKEFAKSDAHGMVKRVLQIGNPGRSLIDAVALTEHCLQVMVSKMYVTFPERYFNTNQNNSGSLNQQIKLVRLIIESPNRKSMIDEMVEEKVRGIFYGNPTHFFMKDKTKIGLGDHFSSQFNNAISMYQEVIARRNVYAHNGGRVDRKYLREVKNPQFKLNEKIQIDEKYLKEASIILLGLVATTTKVVILNVLHGEKEKLNKFIESAANYFEKHYKD